MCADIFYGLGGPFAVKSYVYIYIYIWLNFNAYHIVHVDLNHQKEINSIYSKLSLFKNIENMKKLQKSKFRDKLIALY